jgi:hypothetical protein
VSYPRRPDSCSRLCVTKPLLRTRLAGSIWIKPLLLTGSPFDVSTPIKIQQYILHLYRKINYGGICSICILLYYSVIVPFWRTAPLYRVRLGSSHGGHCEDLLSSGFGAVQHDNCILHCMALHPIDSILQQHFALTTSLLHLLMYDDRQQHRLHCILPVVVRIS